VENLHKKFSLIDFLKQVSKFMTDVHNKKTRSYNMSMIRSKDTPVRPAGGKPEIIVRKFLFENGFCFKEKWLTRT